MLPDLPPVGYGHLPPAENSHIDPYLTVDGITDADLTRRDIARRYPHLLEYTALEGRPCWLIDAGQTTYSTRRV